MFCTYSWLHATHLELRPQPRPDFDQLFIRIMSSVFWASEQGPLAWEGTEINFDVMGEF